MTGMRPRGSIQFLLGLTIVALVATACGGATATTSPATSGATTASPSVATTSAPTASSEPVVLVVWDSEPKDSPIDLTLIEANKRFEALHPNVTVKHVVKSYEDLVATLKLAISDGSGPDIVQVNQGWTVLGPLVQAKALVPLDAFSTKYGWGDIWSDYLVQLNSFTQDGKTWGTGSLYEVPFAASMVGLYYNKALLTQLGLEVPKTRAEFLAAVDAAKAAGITPLAAGDLEKWPGAHLFEGFNNGFANHDDIRNSVFSLTDAPFNSPANIQTADFLIDLVKRGAITESVIAVSINDALADFGAGKALFFLQGTWFAGDVGKKLGPNAGFTWVPASETEAPAATGGAVAFAMSAGSKHQDVAGDYLNFLASDEIANVLAQNAYLPARPIDEGSVRDADPFFADQVRAYGEVTAANGLVPYYEFATPTLFDVFQSSLQELLAGRINSTSFVETVQADLDTFRANR